MTEFVSIDRRVILILLHIYLKYTWETINLIQMDFLEGTEQMIFLYGIIFEEKQVFISAISGLGVEVYWVQLLRVLTFKILHKR